MVLVNPQRGDHADREITGIGDIDVAIGINHDVPGIVEKGAGAVGAAGNPRRAGECADNPTAGARVQPDFADSLVAGVGDIAIKVVPGIECQAHGMVKTGPLEKGAIRRAVIAGLAGESGDDTAAAVIRRMALLPESAT